MNAKQLFIEYPELDLVYQAGSSEAFADEEECKNYANHFNVSMKTVKREEVSGLPARKENKKVFSDEDFEGVEVDEDGKLSVEAKDKLIKNHVDRLFKEEKVKRGKAKQVTGAVEPESKEGTGAVEPESKQGTGAVEPESKEGTGAVEPESKEGTGAVEPESKEGTGAVEPESKEGAGAVEPESKESTTDVVETPKE